MKAFIEKHADALATILVIAISFLFFGFYGGYSAIHEYGHRVACTMQGEQVTSWFVGSHAPETVCTHVNAITAAAGSGANVVVWLVFTIAIVACAGWLARKHWNAFWSLSGVWVAYCLWTIREARNWALDAYSPANSDARYFLAASHVRPEVVANAAWVITLLIAIVCIFVAWRLVRLWNWRSLLVRPR
jgi:hypothetical protein